MTSARDPGLKDGDGWRQRRGRDSLGEKRWRKGKRKESGRGSLRNHSLLLSTVASLWQSFFFSQALSLSFSSCLVSHSCSHSLLPCLSICEGPTSLLSKITLQCQYKSHTHVTHTHTRTSRPLMCWKRVTFFFSSTDCILTLSSQLVPLESWVRQTSNVNSEELESLIFLSDTFSPLSPQKTLFVSIFVWLCQRRLTVFLCAADTIYASWDISIPDRRMISVTFGSPRRLDVLASKTTTQSAQIWYWRRDEMDWGRTFRII